MTARNPSLLATFPFLLALLAFGCARYPVQDGACDDGIKNQDESDVDCGGSCVRCSNGLVCLFNGDCQSSNCDSGTCQPQPAECTDGMHNGDETDTDCGGSCTPCADGSTCQVDGDCLSSNCQNGTCQPRPPECDDGLLNGDETDVDCGGSCTPCANGSTCIIDSDCLSGNCEWGVCEDSGQDLCPDDPDKTEPGVCGCGVPDDDSDGDGFADCIDLCPADPGKIDPGVCGCGTPDTDSDGDGVLDCDFCAAPTHAAQVFVTERYSGELLALDGCTGNADWVLGGLDGMVGATVAPSGAVYVARYAAGAISEVPAGGGSYVDVSTELSNPHGIWYDIATETLLVTRLWSGEVHEVDPSTGTATLVVSGLLRPKTAVRRPGEDLIYIADRGGGGGVYTYDPSTGAPELLADVEIPSGLLLAEEGVLYVTTDAGHLYQVDTGTGSATLLHDDFGMATSLCHDPAGGAVLVATHDYNTVQRYDLNTGSVTTFSTETSTPWDCAVHMPADGDADGHFSIFYGGTDCDDEDGSVYPGNGC